MSRHKPMDPLNIPQGTPATFMRLPLTRDIDGADFAVVGIPFDTGRSYEMGARHGPIAVRRASVMVRPYNPVLDVDVFEILSGVDYGDLPTIARAVDNTADRFSPGPLRSMGEPPLLGYIQQAYSRIVEGLAPVLAAGVFPIVIGGDHSVSLGMLRAIAEKYGRVSLIEFDAHFDTSDIHSGNKYDQATMFRRAVEEGLVDARRSIQLGMRGSLFSKTELEQNRDLGYRMLMADDVLRMTAGEIAGCIQEAVGDSPTYLTFDVDFVDAAEAPGSYTLEFGGIPSRQALQIVRALTGINYVGFDIVGVIEAMDVSNLTALLSANVAFEFLSVLARQRLDARARG